MIFTTCIQSLLGTLKLWDPARHGAEGLALMLSASSPSDTEHRFNRCEIKDSYPFYYAEDIDLAPGMVDFHRTNITGPFSRHFHRSYPPPLYSEHVKRLQGTPLRLELQRGEQGRFTSQCKSLPAVHMIKGLIMRRQFHREIHIGTLSWLLSRSFVALEWFRFERTISPEPHKQISFDQAFKWSEVAQNTVIRPLPTTLSPLWRRRQKFSKSDGVCIYQHLLLKDLVFDPITQIILENEPYGWSLDEKRDLWQQGGPLNSNLSNPNSLGGDLLINSLELDADLASLQADLMALDAKTDVFIQQHHM